MGLRHDSRTVWLFDLDNTLHDAGAWVFGALHQAMGEFTASALQLSLVEAQQLNHRYWHRHGATLLGLVRHHGILPAQFLHDTHRLPGLEQRLDAHGADLAALRRLRGRKFIVTNAPRAYAWRVLRALRIAQLFDGLVAIDDMAMFGQLRPKPDARMLRTLAVGLRVPPRRCVLVEDTLQHQKAARRVGMRTVWMQRFVRRAAAAQPLGSQAARLSMQPAYVDLRVRRLAALCR